MSISETYATIILETIIREILDEGIPLSISEIDERYKAFVADSDLSQPLFDQAASVVVRNESASATKWNNTNDEIARDLTVLYKELLAITDDSIKSFDRWRTQTLSMQAQIRKLDTRVSDLLRTQVDKNTHFIVDDFVDTSRIDLTNTTAFVNLAERTIGLSVSNKNPTKISLNKILPSDVQFTVLTRKNLQSVFDSAGGDLVNAFDDVNNFWQTKVITNNSHTPITAELKVNIAPTIQPISKITFTLHSSGASPIQITPMLSIDGVNFTQLDTSNITQSVTSKGTWSFPSIDTLVVKFIMTKNGYDVIENGNYVYEFGAQDVSFFNESFEEDNTQTFQSSVLSALDIDGNPVEFNAVELEVCERIPANTGIDYSIAGLNAIDDSPVWIFIDHVAQDNPLTSKKINLGSTNNITLEDVTISYDATASGNLVNPGSSFTLVSLASGNVISTVLTTANSRYMVVNTNERILDHQIEGSIDIANVEIFRNVGSKSDTELVRQIQRGWTYSEPYYITNIEIFNQLGLLIDFGDKQIVFDNVLTNGRTLIPQGIHNIKVHKNSWIQLPIGITTLEELKVQDPLYPFNQKYLIEGYDIQAGDNPYRGVDIFAGYYMKEVSIYDMVNNVPADDYSKFGIDTDATIPTVKESSTVFMVKSNENYSDFLDEIFTVRFDVHNQMYRYLKFKADLTTTDSLVTPNLDGYKLKITN